MSGYVPQSILSTISPELQRFAADAVSDRIHSLIGNAEAQPPYIKTRNVWGARYDAGRLVTSTGWKELGRWGIQNGSVSCTVSSLANDMKSCGPWIREYLWRIQEIGPTCIVSRVYVSDRLRKMASNNTHQQLYILRIIGGLFLPCVHDIRSLSTGLASAILGPN